MAIAEPVARKPRKSPPKRPDSESTFPTFREPQLATLLNAVPAADGWGLRDDKPAAEVKLEVNAN